MFNLLIGSGACGSHAKYKLMYERDVVEIEKCRKDSMEMCEAALKKDSELRACRIEFEKEKLVLDGHIMELEAVCRNHGLLDGW